MKFSTLSNIPKKFPWLEPLLKVIIFVLLFASIGYQVFYQRNVEDLLLTLSKAYAQGFYFGLSAFLLMPLNWCLEAWKWHMLINKVEKVSYRRSVMAIFAGTTFTFFTPNRIGEYGGRFIFLKDPLKIKPLQATILGSIAQIVVTLVVGLLGMAWVLHTTTVEGIHWSPIVSLMLGLLGFVLLFLYYKMDMLHRFSNGRKLPKRLKDALASLIHFNGSELTVVLLLSFLRYAVYSLQYLLLLWAFGIEISVLSGLSVVSAIFLIQTIVPSIAAFDLGIRGNVALFMLGTYSSEPASIVAAAFSLWAVNLVLAALIGYLFLSVSRIFKN